MKFLRWIRDHILWDPGVSTREDFWTVLWAPRKLAIALAIMILLTWTEWIEHHPPEIALIAVMHFVVVLAVIAIAVSIMERLASVTRR